MTHSTDAIYPWGVIPNGRQERDPCQGDSLSRDLSCLYGGSF